MAWRQHLWHLAANGWRRSAQHSMNVWQRRKLKISMAAANEIEDNNIKKKRG